MAKANTITRVSGYRQGALQSQGLEILDDGIVRLQTGTDWDKWFRTRFPLAPSSWVNQIGSVNRTHYETYDLELRVFRKRDTKHTIETAEVVKHYLPPCPDNLKPLVRDLGLGLGDTIAWMCEAFHMGFWPEGWDYSQVSREASIWVFNGLLARPEYGTHGITAEHVLHEGDIEELSQRILKRPTVMDHLVRVVQHWDKDRMVRTLRGLGAQSMPGYGVVVIGHPFPEDNPTYDYVSSFAHFEGDLLAPLSEGAGQTWICLKRSKPLSYFGGKQYYRWATFGPESLRKHFSG